ncbi:MAG TPA: BTAD domain-containing putative transcriptional regulator [Flexivirga sp.]|uniref:ATP-binding protein n=1 Tax=Flexivirga sp. TaxID=1962927 RepID=UPI002BB66F5D|nr:BTAD domain-containing putative transcriptional regulator [Flexivirga sp.]HWC23501.1 BTAD domain-containing putative transcriptional regulator [Flexivirga sp.]
MTVRLIVLPEIALDGKAVTSTAIGRLVLSLAADLRAGVSSARLIDELWPKQRPEHPSKALQVLVSRARSALGHDLIASTPAGYRLTLAEEEVDATAIRLRTVAAQRAAREGDPEGALRHSDAGLALWSEAATSDPDPDDPVQQLRRDTLSMLTVLRRERGLALAALGRHIEAKDVLAQCAESGAEDETVLAALIRAEAATGSRSAALDRYERHRRSLRDHLGTDPGPALRAVHRELLDSDRPQIRSGVEHDPNPLLGRDRDIDALCALTGTVRVTSIVGPGGLGKTRLAHAVSRRSLQRTVHFVGLAGVTDSADVATEVATALGVTGVSTRAGRTTEAPTDLTTGIARNLSGGSALLVLDNCEHVLDGAVALVRSLVAMLPELRILTTTRAPLGLSSETTYPLAELQPDTAAELFTQRARAVRPAIELPDDVVHRLCARLDGLPLALELAAARTNVLSVEQIEQRLGDRFALLNRGARDAPDRHRTLQAVIDWSWQLLGAAEQEALAILSVFADGFELEAAGAVLADAASATGIDPMDDPVDIVEHLVDQSLLRRLDRDGRPRFRMLETVREFGAEQLARTDRTEAALRAVTVWAATTSRTYGPLLFGPEPDAALHFLLAEEDNLTAALRTAIEYDDPVATAAVFGALGALWSVQSRHEQVFGPAADAMRVISHYRPGPQDVEITRQALVLGAVNLNIVGNPTGLRAIVLLQRMPPAAHRGMVEALGRLMTAEDGGRLPTGRRLLDAERALELAESGDSMLRVTAMLLASHVLENDGRVAEALQIARRAVHQEALADTLWGTLVNQSRVAELSSAIGEYAEAERTAERILPLLERFGAQGDITSMRWLLATLRLHRGDLAGATRQLQAVSIDEAEDAFGEGTTGLAIRAELELAKGQVDSGLHRYRAAVEHAETRSHLAPFIGEETVTPWVTIARAGCLAAHAVHGRLEQVAGLAQQLAESLREVSRDIGKPTTLVIRVDLPVCGCAVLGLSYALASSAAATAAERAQAAQGVALSNALGVSRTPPAMSFAPAERFAIQTDAPAYASGQKMYAGTGRDELLKQLAEWLDGLPQS